MFPIAFNKLQRLDLLKGLFVGCNHELGQGLVVTKAPDEDQAEGDNKQPR